MDTNLSHALRLSTTTCLALVGSGGKTTALFQLSHELAPAIITTSTHLGVWQVAQASRHIILDGPHPEIEASLTSGVTLVTGPLVDDRYGPVTIDILSWLRTFSINHNLPLLIEADGSRQKPLKAPSEHEPVIPGFTETIVVIAGLSGLGKPLTEETVHRPDIYARLCGLGIGETITAEAIVRVLTHPAGGVKNIPQAARRVALLNQADTPDLQARAKGIAEKLTSVFDSVLIASLGQNHIHAVHEPVAGIILAAGEAKRFGQPKQLLEWSGKPFIRHVAESALAAGLSPVVVVTGANAERIESTIQHPSISIHRNPNWQSGQSTSIQAGLEVLPPNIGAAIFLLADQPQITPAVLRALVEIHSQELNPIVAPQVHGQRANPVLFDRDTFPALMSLTGDVGGRMIFSKFRVRYLPWHDENLLVDIDTPQDFRKFVDGN